MLKFKLTMGGYDVIYNDRITIGCIDNEGFILQSNPSRFIKLTISELQEIVSFMNDRLKSNKEEKERQSKIEKYRTVITALIGTNTIHGIITIGDVFALGDDAIEFCGMNRWCLNEGLARSEDRCTSAYEELRELKLI